MEGSPPIVALFVDKCISTVGEKGVDDVEMARVGRIVEGSPPTVVFVDRCIPTVGEERVDDIQVAIVARPVERSLPKLVLLVDRCISTVREEGVDDIQMAIAGRTVEGSPPMLVLSNHVCPSLQQLGDACNIPLPTRIVQRKLSPGRHCLSTTGKPRHRSRHDCNTRVSVWGGKRHRVCTCVCASVCVCACVWWVCVGGLENIHIIPNGRGECETLGVSFSLFLRLSGSPGGYTDMIILSLSSLITSTSPLSLGT